MGATTSSRPDLCWWWPSRLVATAAEDRLSILRAHVVAAASDCRTIAIYLLGRTHKSTFCKRLVNVRFAPKATEVLRCRELTRCAKTRHYVARLFNCLLAKRETIGECPQSRLVPPFSGRGPPRTRCYDRLANVVRMAEPLSLTGHKQAAG